MTDMENTGPVWYPFTQMKLADAPIHITLAKGCTLYAADGKEYIDAVSSWWVNIHGHANEYIAQRIAEQARQLEHVIFAGFTHTPAIRLAENLLKILPHFGKVFYSDNGSTAVEVALKMALQYWHNKGNYTKTKIIAFENAYHGDTFGAMSVGARGAFNAPFHRHLFEVIYIPAPNEDNLEQVKKQLQTLARQGDIAAFIFEPLVQGSGGMLMHRATHLDELLGVAAQNGLLCIADEVMTGFGRTGRNFAINYLQNKPDIICLSKGITGGFMPLGATLCTDAIFSAFYSDDKSKTFFHGHSYTANPLACAAALASFELLLNDDCQQRIQNICRRHAEFAKGLKQEPFVKEVRQQGTIVAVELNTDEQSSYFNSIRDEIYRFCIGEGVLLRPLGNTLYIMPPYCITDAELDRIYAVINNTINTFKLKYGNARADK